MTRSVDAVVIVAVVLAIWQALFLYAGDVAITPPLRTFAFAGELFARASFWPHVGATLLAFGYALVISAVAGVALGLLLGLAAVRRRRRRADPGLVLHASRR